MKTLSEYLFIDSNGKLRYKFSVAIQPEVIGVWEHTNGVFNFKLM